MIEIGYSVRGLEGRSGDRAVVVTRPHGMLICAIDGLGHGEAAAEAADVAASAIERYSGEGLDELLRTCHEALGGTRGAVMTMVEFDGARDELTWVGVGNVEARLLPAGLPPGLGSAQSPTLFGGVLGHNMPVVRSSSHPISPGDVLVMVTDGVRTDFETELSVAGPPRLIADRVLERSARDDDDALVVVARWLGDRG
jgi:negative regulator of sigma-B (phosphoserine phosphatase)